MKLVCFAVAAFCILAMNASAQQRQTAKVACYEGDTSLSCTPPERSAKAHTLATGRTAAVIVEAKRTVACGDGSPDSCITPDRNAEQTIRNEVSSSALWNNFDKAEARDADILLKFSSTDKLFLELCAYGAESNEILWCERRSIVALDNDAARLLVHFLEARLKLKRGPLPALKQTQ